MAVITYGLALGKQRALHTYRRMSVETASPGELVLMLYNEAIKTMRDAIGFINEGDPAGSGRCLIKAQDIISELRCSLDYAAGGDVAAKLGGVYDYVYKQLVEANVKKTTRPIEEALALVGEIRLGWQQVLNRNG